MDRHPLSRPSGTVAVLGLLALGLALGGCTDTRRALGLEKATPDEFRVVSRAPLSLPPDYTLRPPTPGATRPQEASSQVAARQTILAAGGAAPAGSVGATGPSVGEAALLSRTGGRQIDPRIRETVERESIQIAENERRFIDRLIFWRNPEEPGSVIDPARESQRIRENAALGRPATDGDTPIIRRRQRGLFEGVF